ncbi:MAG: MFS transporter [Gammaproteobacteria bacterium]|nr:MFS transporter [Gammaproteobacteria bacterium]
MNKNIWLLASCQSLMMTNNALLVTTSALVGVMLAKDASLATLPLALQFLATMLASIPASLLMDKLGRRGGFLLGSMIGLIGGLIATFAIFQADFWLFCLGAVLIGMFNGFGNYYRFAAVDVVSATLKSRAISYVMAGGVVAAILGPNIASWTHDSVANAEFAGSYAIICLLYVLTFIILSFTDLPRRIADIKETSLSRPLSVIIKQPVFIVAVIGGMLGYAVMSLVMTATPLAMSHHHSLNDTAFVIQWHVLGMFAPSFFTGSLISRYGVVNIMLTGTLLLMMAVAGNLLGISLWHYWFALLCLGIGWNFLFIGATDLLTYAYEESEKAKAQAFNDFSVFAAVTLAALTAGYLQHNYGWQIVNLGVIPLIAVILMSLLWIKLKQNNEVGRIKIEEG